MKDIIVFVGPTVSVEAAREELDADYRPPAAQGDVYCAALERPWGIAIIDGYFERVPAVWHKEILWAMSHGVHVFGASSMGALRAAELHEFGMLGVGTIFEAFRDGVWTDDDEVTVVHADAASGLKCMSTAMVDIRATLAAAVAQSVLDAPTRETLVRLAKQRHYAERSYAQLCEDARREGVEASCVARFAEFAREHARHLKQTDALLLLRSLAHWRAKHPEPKAVDFEFEHTDAWQQFTSRFDASASQPGREHAAIIEELRLRPAEYDRIRAAALTRKLASSFASQHSLAIDRSELERTVEKFREEHKLFATDATAAFWRAQGTDQPGFTELMKSETQLRRVCSMLSAGLEPHMLDELRSSGRYAELASRAEQKRAQLSQSGLDVQAPALVDAARDERALLAWYFSKFLAVELPDDLDRFWRDLGYSDVYAFKRALVREACSQNALESLNLAT